MTLWRRYLRWFRGQYWRLALAVVLAIVQSVLVVPAAWLVAWAFDHAIPNGGATSLAAVALGLLALNFSSGALGLWNRHLTLRSTKIAIRDLRVELLRKLYSFSRGFYDRGDRGQLHATIVQDSERVDDLSNVLVAQLAPAVCTATVITAALLYLNAVLFLALVGITPLLVLVNRWFGRRLDAGAERFRKSYEAFSSGVLFVVETIDLARIQTAEKTELNKQKQTLEELRLASGRMYWLYAAHGLAQNNVAIIGSIVILIVGGQAVADSRMTIGELMSFYVVVGLLRGQVTSIVGAYPQIVLGRQSLAALDGLLYSDDVSEYRGTKRISPGGRFALRGVQFDYGAAPVLTNANLELSSGSTVAVIGANGSGKSTLIYLLCGFYRPNKGEVLADDEPYDLLDVSDLRRSMAVVLQDPTFFSGSILDNITYGTDQIEMERVKEAARLATAHEFIGALPNGYETEIGDKGVRLSGGQRQRIAIARALYRRPRLLILDEPTNHLDVDSIRQLLSNLAEEPSPTTTLLVSHDIRVVNQAEDVYLLENGQLRRLDDAELERMRSVVGLSID